MFTAAVEINMALYFEQVAKETCDTHKLCYRMKFFVKITLVPPVICSWEMHLSFTSKFLSSVGWISCKACNRYHCSLNNQTNT